MGQHTERYESPLKTGGAFILRFIFYVWDVGWAFEPVFGKSQRVHYRSTYHIGDAENVKQFHGI